MVRFSQARARKKSKNDLSQKLLAFDAVSNMVKRKSRSLPKMYNFWTIFHEKSRINFEQLIFSQIFIKFTSFSIKKTPKNGMKKIRAFIALSPELRCKKQKNLEKSIFFSKIACFFSFFITTPRELKA